MSNSSKPATRGRFKKGQTGNPNGRPKKLKQQEASAFDIILNKTLTVFHNGVARELTSDEALQHRTYRDATEGSRMAQREILKMIAKREKARAEAGGAPRLHVTRRIEPVDPDNADEALLILGIASRNERNGDWENDREWLLLEPWAVQAALSRRRGSRRLNEKEVNQVMRHTRNSATLRWPRESES